MQKKNAHTYKKKGNYSPIPKSRIQKGAKTIIALRGHDWNRIHIKDIRRLQKKIGAVLALDDGAIVHALKHNIDVLLLEDFLEHSELVNINKQAIDIVSSWHIELKDTHTFDNINFAEVTSHTLMDIWQQILSAYACAKIINEKKIHVILIKEEDDTIPLLSMKNEIFCKVCSLVLNSYNIIILKNPKKTIYTVKNNYFSLKSPIDNKPLVTLANFDIDRAHILLSKLKYICNDVSIISITTCFGAMAKKHKDLNEIIINDPYEFDDNTYLNAFTLAFKSFKENINFLPKELHSFLFQIFKYYYTKYYPELLSKYFAYKELFIKHKPLCVFGNDVGITEALLPIFAANTLGIPTFIWGHALLQPCSYYLPPLSTLILHTAQGLRSAMAHNFPRERCLLVKDQNELDILYKVNPCSWNTKKDKIKILVLPAVAKVFINTSVYFGNYYRKLENIKILCSPPKHLNVDIKFKEHPGFPDLGMQYFLNKNQKKMFFPANDNLSYLLQSADICILLGEVGCALIHTSKLMPTLLVTHTMTGIATFSHASDYPNIVDSPEDIWPWIEKVISSSSYRNKMMKKQQDFHYIDEKTMTFEQTLEKEIKCLQLKNDNIVITPPIATTV